VVRDRQRARARGETPSVGGVIGDVNIVSDSRLNAILISTDERNFPFIEMVLKELDKADTKEEFKIFYLEVADAEQMVDTLQDLILGTGGGSRSSWGRSYMRSRQRRERREWGGPGFGIQGEVNLVAEPRLNAILVSTEEQNLGTMEKIIKQLDTSMPGQEWATEIIRSKKRMRKMSLPSSNRFFKEVAEAAVVTVLGIGCRADSVLGHPARCQATSV